MSIQADLHARELTQLLGRSVRAPTRVQTYRNLIYVLLTFPLGLFYFLLLTIGFPTGLSLAIVLIGIPVLVCLLFAVVGLAEFERTLIHLLLNVEIATPSAETEQSLWDRVKQLVTDLRTWKAVAYLLSEFVFGTVVFGLVSSLVATAGSFLFAPLYYKQDPIVAYGPIPSSEFTLDVLFGWDNLLVGLTTTFQLGSWQIETFPGALLVAGLGLVLLVFTLQLVNALAGIWGRYARRMLTAPQLNLISFIRT